LLDENSVPLWDHDLNNFPKGYWDCKNPPTKEDGTFWFDPKVLPKLKFAGLPFYRAIFVRNSLDGRS